MPKHPKLSGARIIERMTERLARYDRGPFQELLSVAVLAGKGKEARKAWAALAERDPARYAAALASLAKPAGFGERTESISLNVTPEQLAGELMARYGADRARMMLEASGLPVALVDAAISKRISEIPAAVVVESAETEAGAPLDPRPLPGGTAD